MANINFFAKMGSYLYFESMNFFGTHGKNCTTTTTCGHNVSQKSEFKVCKYNFSLDKMALLLKIFIKMQEFQSFRVCISTCCTGGWLILHAYDQLVICREYLSYHSKFMSMANMATFLEFHKLPIKQVAVFVSPFYVMICYGESNIEICISAWMTANGEWM